MEGKNKPTTSSNNMLLWPFFFISSRVTLYILLLTTHSFNNHQNCFKFILLKFISSFLAVYCVNGASHLPLQITAIPRFNHILTPAGAEEKLKVVHTTTSIPLHLHLKYKVDLISLYLYLLNDIWSFISYPA